MLRTAAHTATAQPRHADPTAGNVALWGQDVGSLVGQTLIFGGTGPGTGYSETLPGFTATTPDLNITLCLSCHDGNLAKGAMMKNAVYETLPSTYGTYNTIPTLLGNDGTTAGNYLNDHPVGLNAAIGCGGQYNWDCTIVNGAITYPSGTKMYQFVQNYGFFVSPSNYNGTPVVTCTTCHNQHLMNVVKVTHGLEVRSAFGLLPDDVLRPRALQPGAAAPLVPTRRRSSAASATVAKLTK